MLYREFKTNQMKNLSKTVEVTGTPPLTFTKSKGKNLKDYKVYGNSEQESKLPSGYTQVEYLQSDGNSYIDTGIGVGSNDTLECTWANVFDSDNNLLKGSYENKGWGGNLSDSGDNIYGFNGGGREYDGKISFWMSDNYTTTINPEILNKIYKDVVTVDGTTTTIKMIDTSTNEEVYNTSFERSNYSNPRSVYLFRDNSDDPYPGIKKIYKYKLIKDGITVRELLPCYRNSDSVLGMYDIANDVFYTNQDIGTFTAGVTVPTPNVPIDIVSCGDKTVNIFDLENADIVYNNSTTNIVRTRDSVSFYCNRTSSFILFKIGNRDDLLGKTITLSAKEEYLNMTIVCCQTDGSGRTLKSKTLTITSDLAPVICVRCYNLTQTAGTTTVMENIQVEEGNTATSYEPYGYKIPVKVVTNSAYVKLPSDYTQVEYLKSTGTQYINTGYNITATTETKLKFAVNSSTTYANASFLFGRYNGTSLVYSVALTSTSTLRIPNGGTFTTIAVSNYSSGVHTLDYKFGDVKLDNVQVSTYSGTATTTGEMWLFYRNATTATPTSFNLYSCEIYDNGELERNFIPCYRKSDSVAGLYDLVNDAFYTNVGTGTFEIGEEIIGTTTNIYLDEPLRKVGEADLIEFLKQKRTNKNKSIVLSAGTHTLSDAKSNGNYICSQQVPGTLTGQVLTLNTGVSNAEVIYQLSTPTEESISLPSISTYKGTNIASIGTTLNASNMSIKYIK